MTFENISHIIASDNGVLAVSLGSTITSPYGALIVPRNTRASLTFVHGSVADAEDILESDNRCVIALARVADQLPSTWVDVERVWSHVMTRSIVGTPANAAILSGGVELEKFLSGQANTSILNTGARSNITRGWALLGISSAGNYSIYADIVLMAVFEWINGSGNKKNWPMEIMIEEEGNT